MTPNKLVCFLITSSVIILMISQGSSGVKQGYKSEVCAVCKHHRRRCAPDCIFRAYFPADRHQDFRNVHRLFGISNVKHMLGRMTPELRGDGIKSIIYEASLWSRFPGQGCPQLIRLLQHQIALLTAELGRTRTQITARAAASNPAAADVSNTSAAFFYPPAANFFYPPTANFFDPAAFNFFIPTTAVESELINPSPNLVANNERVLPVSDDGTIDLLCGGGQCCNIAYEEECVTEPETSATANNNDVQQSIPNLNINLGTSAVSADDFDFVAGLEASGGAPLNDVQQSIPNPNNLGSSPGPLALDDFDFVAGLEASGGVPPNDDPLRDFDFGFTDAERSFFGIQDSGDKCGSADKSFDQG